MTLRQDAVPFVLPRTDVRSIASETGVEYRVLIGVPEQPPPPDGHPVLYLLDAHATFGTVVEAVRMRGNRSASTGVVPAVVIGVAHAIDGTFDRARRVHDFTPERSEADRPDDDDTVGMATGGAPAFLDLLVRVQRELEPSLGIDPSRRGLMGHSLGGLFALHALLERPGLFARTLAMSPSLWWNWHGLRARVAALASSGVRVPEGTGVMLSVGEYEESLAPWQAGVPNADAITRRRLERRMVSRARELSGLLAQVPGLRVSFEEFAGEDHASVVPMAISRGLRFLLPPAGVAP